MMTAVVPLVPAAAQDSGFSDTEQAALDEVRAALERFVNLDSYSATISQQTKQDIGITYLGQKIRLLQEVDAQGTMQVDKDAEGEFDNQQLSLTEMISQQISGGGADQDSQLGPVLLDLITVDDRVYMRVKIESDSSGVMPQGWVDVTDGMEAFPGMGMFDIRQMLEMGVFGPENLTAWFDSVITVKVREPAEVDGQTINTYRLGFDAAKALETFGTANMESMFNANALPFDIAALIDLIYSDEDTTFIIDFGIGADDQQLTEMTQVVTMDIAIGSELITDPSLKNADMTLLQTSIQSYQFYGFDEPVTISAPDVTE
jgi:hypothetical protein